MDFEYVLKFWLWDLRVLTFYFLVAMLVSVTVLAIMAKYLNSQVVYFTEYKNLENYTVVMTGALEGVGKEAAKEFYKRGARLIIGCEDMRRGEEMARDLSSESTESSSAYGSLVTIPLDLSSIQSVRTFAQHVNRLEKKINLLCLTYSTSAARRKELSEDNLEKTMASNYFGHFLLTILLYKLIRSTKDSRIIILTSRIYTFLSKISATDLNFEGERYTAMRSSSLSMLCLVLFSKHFARLASKFNVRVNCFSPGFISQSSYDSNADVISSRMRRWVGYLVGRTPHQGCQTLLFLAMAGNDRVGSGGMFSDCRSVEFEGLAADDELLAQQVYEQTEDILQLTEEERKVL